MSTVENERFVLEPNLQFLFIQDTIRAVTRAGEVVEFPLAFTEILSSFSNPTTREELLKRFETAGIEADQESLDALLSPLLEQGIILAIDQSEVIDDSLHWKYVRRAQVLAKQYGHGRGLKSALPQTDEGELLPLYSWAAIEYLQRLDFSECTILEFGSGNSTIW